MKQISKLEPSVTMSCNFGHTQSSMASEQFYLANSSERPGIKPWYGFHAISNRAAQWNHLHTTI